MVLAVSSIKNSKYTKGNLQKADDSTDDKTFNQISRKGTGLIMQDKILLGLLLEHKTLTTYETQKLMEISTSLFYTTSLGSINPAFKKLENKGAVKSEEKIENGRLKKYYSITEKGKEIFFNWMEEDISISKVKIDILLKLFFFSQISMQQKKTLLENYLENVKKHLKQMDGVNDYCKENKLIGSPQHDTLRFGIDYYNFVYDWFKKYMQNLGK